MKTLIGISGKKRAGKDTVAETLVGEFGFVRYAFADVMKAAMLTLDPIVYARLQTSPFASFEGAIAHPVRLSTLVEAYGWEGAKEEPEVRRLLQVFGTEVGRAMFGEDFWVDQTMHRILREDRPVVVTDVRFPNEYEAIGKAGGLLVRVNRPGMTHDDEHPSETALDTHEFPLTIRNDSTLDELAMDARRLVALASL